MFLIKLNQWLGKVNFNFSKQTKRRKVIVRIVTFSQNTTLITSDKR